MDDEYESFSKNGRVVGFQKAFLNDEGYWLIAQSRLLTFGGFLKLGTQIPDGL